VIARSLYCIPPHKPIRRAPEVLRLRILFAEAQVPAEDMILRAMILLLLPRAIISPLLARRFRVVCVWQCACEPTLNLDGRPAPDVLTFEPYDHGFQGGMPLVVTEHACEEKKGGLLATAHDGSILPALIGREPTKALVAHTAEQPGFLPRASR